MLCPDLKIAANFKSKCTKTKQIIKNALSPHFHEEHVQSLRSTHLSVIIDETTDISTCKEMATVTRFYDKQSSTVKCQLYDLLELPQGDAETMFQALVDSNEKNKICFNNIIGYASDSCNVMFVQHNSVVSCLKEKFQVSS